MRRNWVLICLGLLVLAGGMPGRPAAATGGLLVAISLAMSCYSRYYIREMLFVVFTFGAILAGWRYLDGAAGGRPPSAGPSRSGSA